MVGATGIEPVTPTMSTSESPVLYVHITVFIDFKDLIRLHKMYVQYLNYQCLHTIKNNMSLTQAYSQRNPPADFFFPWHTERILRGQIRRPSSLKISAASALLANILPVSTHLTALFLSLFDLFLFD